MKVFLIQPKNIYFSSLVKMMEWAIKDWLDVANNHPHYFYFRTIRPSPFSLFQDKTWKVFEYNLNCGVNGGKQISIEVLDGVFKKVSKKI